MCQPSIMANEHALTTWRKTQKLSQEELAIKLGISRWYVNRLEVRERTPSFELAHKIEKLSSGEVKPMDFVRSEASE